MHIKSRITFVMASALAFFLLTFSVSFAETADEGVKAAAMQAKQALQALQAEPQSTPVPSPQPTPSPTPTTTATPAPPQPAQTQAHPPAAPPVPPAPEQPKPKPRLFLPAPPRPAARPQPGQPPEHPAAQTPQTAAPAAPEKGSVSFNFDDADVYSVIQTIFGDVLRVNYVIDPAVKGRVTFRSVEPVAKKDVLPLMEVILRLNGIGIVEEGTLYRIIPIADISKEPAPVEVGRDPDKVKINGKALVQIVQIKYMQSSDMVKILTPFLSKNAVIVDVPNSNYIVIVDTDSNVRRMLRMVNLFDNEELKAVTPRVFVYPVQNGKAKDVANILQQIFLGAKPSPATKTPVTPARRTLPGQPPAVVKQPEPQIFTSGGGTGSVVADDTKIIADEVTNSLIILATPDDYEKIKDAIGQIDIPPRQVMIEALIVSLKLTDNLSFGLSWSLNTDIKLHPFKNDINLNGGMAQNPGNLDLTTNPVPSNGFTFIGTDPTGNVRAVLTALQDHSNATVVAAPHILVSDNKEASIQIGSQVPLATSQTTTPIGTGTEITNTTTSTIQYKDIGIILKVKPQVNDSGLISLEFSQEISSVGQTVQVGGQNEVTIDKTEAQSNLVAQNGETIVIGGLIRQDKTKDRTGIPFLSRIPVLGYLFGNTSDQKTRTELVILLTPYVVRNEKEAQSVTSDYMKRYEGVTKNKDVEQFVIEPKGAQKDQDGVKQKHEPKEQKAPDQSVIPSPSVSP